MTGYQELHPPFVLLLCLGASAACSADAPTPSRHADALVGAWRIVETTRTTPDSSWTNESAQPGLYIFTHRHFSIMLIPGDSPRSELPPNASPEQRLAAFEDFIADAGSYQATDSVITMRNIIAKVPNVMTSGAGGPYRYRITGDTLSLSFTRGWAAGGETTYRLVRLE